MKLVKTIALCAAMAIATQIFAKGPSRGKTRVRESGDYVTEKRSDGSTVKYKKKESYDFEGLGVEAASDRPSGAYVSNIRDVKGKKMIQIRKNFDLEVAESVRQMP